MTPYDKENDVELTVPENAKVVAHISCPEPMASDPGDDLDTVFLHNRIANLERYLDEAHRELEGYRIRERQILDVIHRHQREDAYRRLHAQGVTDAVEQGRLTSDQPMRENYDPGVAYLNAWTQHCDCTMGRESLLQNAIRTLRGR